MATGHEERGSKVSSVASFEQWRAVVPFSVAAQTVCCVATWMQHESGVDCKFFVTFSGAAAHDGDRQLAAVVRLVHQVLHVPAHRGRAHDLLLLHQRKPTFTE